LSTAKRDLGGTVTASGVVVFGGGCTGGESVFTCEEASDVIDLFNAGSKLAISTSALPSLTYARGWPATCAYGEFVAFLGGGTSGSRPHKPVLDVLDLTDRSAPVVQGNTSALDAGRWGTSCVAFGKNVYFAGGKEVTFLGQYKMTDEVLVLPSNDAQSLSVDGLVKADFKLSVARESTGAVMIPNLGFMIAGGWISQKLPGTPSAVVDSFALGSATGLQTTTWNLKNPSANQYWVGVCTWNETMAFVADSTVLYIVTPDVFSGKADPLEVPLPTEVASASGIPAARIPQNGVKVADSLACFYTTTPNGLVCYEPDSGTFSMHPCSSHHTAGAITGTSHTVYIAGGVGPDGKSLTDVVDVLSFTNDNS
jgi:hypothetical protein